MKTEQYFLPTDQQMIFEVRIEMTRSFTSFFRRSMKYYEALSMIGGYQIAVFFIFNFLLSSFRERMYLTSMLRHLYQYDLDESAASKEEKNFDINGFQKIDPSRKGVL